MVSSLQFLISQWKIRLKKGTQSEDYKCALGECIYELLHCLRKESSIQKFLPREIEDSFLSEEADKIAHEISIYNEEH